MYLALYVQAARRHRVIVAALTTLGLLAATLASWQQAPCYEARSQVLVRFVPEPGMTPTAANVDALEQGLVKTYVGIVATERVTAPVVRRLRLPFRPGELGSRIRASSRIGSALIDIAVVDTVAQRAAQIGDALAVQLAALADGTNAVPAIAAAPVISLTVEAAIPTSPVPVRWASRLVVGLLAGLAIGLGGATFRYQLAARGEPLRAWLAALPAGGWAALTAGSGAAGRRIAARVWARGGLRQ